MTDQLHALEAAIEMSLPDVKNWSAIVHAVLAAKTLFALRCVAVLIAKMNLNIT